VLCVLPLRRHRTNPPARYRKHQCTDLWFERLYHSALLTFIALQAGELDSGLFAAYPTVEPVINVLSSEDWRRSLDVQESNFAMAAYTDHLRFGQMHPAASERGNLRTDRPKDLATAPLLRRSLRRQRSTAPRPRTEIFGISNSPVNCRPIRHLKPKLGGDIIALKIASDIAPIPANGADAKSDALPSRIICIPQLWKVLPSDQW